MSWKKPSAKYKIWDFAQGNLEAEYLEAKYGLGQSTLYVFKTRDGNECGVWGCSALDNQMKSAVLGDTVKVVYLGFKKSKNGREYKNYEVQIWDNETAN